MKNKVRITLLNTIYGEIKKMPKYFKRFWKIYTVFLCLFLGILLYFGLYSGDKREEHSSLLEKTTEFERVKSEFETAADTMDLIVQLITQYDVTREYAKENISSYSNLNFERILKLAKLLKKIQTDFSSYNPEIFITRLSDGMIVSGNGNSYSFTDGEFENINLTGAVSAFGDEADDLSATVVKTENLQDNVCFVYRKTYDDAYPLYIFITFSYENMKFCCDRTGMCYILSDYSEDSAAAVIESVNKFGNRNVIEYLKVSGGKSVIFSQMNIADTDIIYAKTFTAENGYGIWLIILLFFIIAIFSCVIGFVFATYSYIPFSMLIKKIGINNGDNIDEVFEAERKLDDIITNTNYMEKTVSDKNKIIFNHFVFDLLNGFIWGKNIRGKSAEYDAEFIYGECGLCILMFEEEIEKDCAHEMLKELLAEIHNCVTADLFDGCTAVIFKSGAERKNMVFDCIDSIRKHCELNVAYAETNGSDGRIAKDYRTLMNGLENKVLTGTKSVISIEDVRGLCKDRIVYTVQTEIELKKYCEAGEKGKALYCLKGIIDNNFSDNAKVFMSLKYALLITVKRILSSLNISEIDFFGEQFNLDDEIIGSESYAKLQQIMKEVIEMICDDTCEDIYMDDMGKKIIDYIDNNLHKDISISDVADALGVSTSYISKTLRSCRDTSFKVYIDETRVKLAKKMMDEDRNILIKDIAQNLGYNNVVSFIRMFKKVEGISPGAYQKMR